MTLEKGKREHDGIVNSRLKGRVYVDLFSVSVCFGVCFACVIGSVAVGVTLVVFAGFSDMLLLGRCLTGF